MRLLQSACRQDHSGETFDGERMERDRRKLSDAPRLGAGRGIAPSCLAVAPNLRRSNTQRSRFSHRPPSPSDGSTCPASTPHPATHACAQYQGPAWQRFGRPSIAGCFCERAARRAIGWVKVAAGREHTATQPASVPGGAVPCMRGRCLLLRRMTWRRPMLPISVEASTPVAPPSSCGGAYKKKHPLTRSQGGAAVPAHAVPANLGWRANARPVHEGGFAGC